MRSLKFVKEYELSKIISSVASDEKSVIVKNGVLEGVNLNVVSIEDFLLNNNKSNFDKVILDVRSSEDLHKCLIALDNFNGKILAPKQSASNRNKPIIVISPPKSGTHLLLKLFENFGYIRGGILPIQPNDKHYYTLDFDSPHTSCSDFFRKKNIQGDAYGGRLSAFNSCNVVAMFRHPRDIFRSALNYNFDPENTIFGNYLKGSSRLEKAKALVDKNSLVGDLPNILNDMANWVSFPNVLAFSFEEFVGSDSKPDSQPVWEMMLRLQISGYPDKIIEASFGKSNTFSQGKVFAKDVEINLISEDIYYSCGYYMDFLGYNKTSYYSDFFLKQRLKAKTPIDFRPKNKEIRIERNDDFDLFYYNKKYHLKIKDFKSILLRKLFSTPSPNAKLHLENCETLKVSFEQIKVFEAIKSGCKRVVYKIKNRNA